MGCSNLAAPESEAVYNAPVATTYSEGRFDGTWYKHSLSQPCLNEMRISHDTLGRYNINESPCDTLYSTEAYTGYATGDFLRIYGVPEHHQPEMWLHLEQGRQLLILSYELDRHVGSLGQLPTELVRDTFLLDPARVKR